MNGLNTTIDAIGTETLKNYNVVTVANNTLQAIANIFLPAGHIYLLIGTVLCTHGTGYRAIELSENPSLTAMSRWGIRVPATNIGTAININTIKVFNCLTTDRRIYLFAQHTNGSNVNFYPGIASYVLR